VVSLKRAEHEGARFPLRLDDQGNARITFKGGSVGRDELASIRAVRSGQKHLVGLGDLDPAFQPTLHVVAVEQLPFGSLAPAGLLVDPASAGISAVAILWTVSRHFSLLDISSAPILPTVSRKGWR
jgi:hypothetical protein